MKRKGIIKVVVLSAMVLFISGMVWAQQGDATADNMQIVRDKIQADKKLLVATNMNLTENEAKAFWPVYDSYQKDLIKLNDRTLKNISDYAANVDKMSDDMAKKIVKEHLAIESEQAETETVLPFQICKGLAVQEGDALLPGGKQDICSRLLRGCQADPAG